MKRKAPKLIQLPCDRRLETLLRLGEHPWPLAIVIVAAIWLLLSWTANAQGSCSAMRAYAQASANYMAQRDAMGDHDYFHAQPHIGGENIGYGYKSEASMVAAWWRSPGHAANMRLHYPCKVIAHARSRSGKLYWAMEVGQ